jgi:hypothetical protein
MGTGVSSAWGASWGASWGDAWGSQADDSLIGGGGGRFYLPPQMINAQALRAIDEDDTLLLLAGALAVGWGMLQ